MSSRICRDRSCWGSFRGRSRSFGAITRAFPSANSKRQGSFIFYATSYSHCDADAAQVDALDEQAVEKHASAIVKKVGAIEISFNSTGIPQQGILMTGTVANLTGGRVAELGTESQLEAPR